MKEALKHFKKVDRIFYSIAVKIPLDQRSKSQNLFIDLVESIISQQLSIKASDTIFQRFKKLFKNEDINPKELLKLKDDEIRACGISYSKIKYIKGIAEAVINKNIDLDKLDQLSDEEVVKELTKLKGIGKWTAEMFLMFSIVREDIFSTGDLGLQNAIKKIYNLDGKPTLAQLEEISSKWSPHRTIASRILWRSLEL